MFTSFLASFAFLCVMYNNFINFNFDNIINNIIIYIIYY